MFDFGEYEGLFVILSKIETLLNLALQRSLFVKILKVLRRLVPDRIE